MNLHQHCEIADVELIIQQPEKVFNKSKLFYIVVLFYCYIILTVLSFTHSSIMKSFTQEAWNFSINGMNRYDYDVRFTSEHQSRKQYQDIKSY